MKINNTSIGSKVLSLLIIGVVFFVGCGKNEPINTENTAYTLYYPDRDLGILFHDIQTSGLFADSKYFVDFTPKSDPKKIEEAYLAAKDKSGFSLADFVKLYFEEPASLEQKALDTTALSLEEYLPKHWDYLTRESQKITGYSSLIPLPNPYVVPGGRFREIYYWDSYFTMIGLGASGRLDLVESMLDNFAYLVDTVGFIPNGNRSYFLSRSQPPFFGSMVSLFGQYKGVEAAAKYLPQLQEEYDFWMQGSENLKKEGDSFRRVVMVGDGLILNRYYDDNPEPRPESYHEDIKLAGGLSEEQSRQLYTNLRAACESGWDFSTRWFADSSDFQSIITTHILPVDLNSLLYKTEMTLAQLYEATGDVANSDSYLAKAERRKELINKMFWNAEQAMYTDYNFVNNSLSNFKTLAGTYPLYFKISSQENAATTANTLISSFLYPGGVATTQIQSGQQWDLPNGWAPLQWTAIKGLEHYEHMELATTISNNWLTINEKVFQNTHKMMEKYNVTDTTLLAGGGEYPNQDGFGWTNGIAIALIKGTEKY
jgi:alpha,alpha-trehalase